MNWFSEMLCAMRGIALSLRRIADVVEKLNVESDFSAEDRIVRDTTTAVGEAKSRIPKPEEVK